MQRFMRAAMFVLAAALAAVVVGSTARAKGPNPPPPALTFTPGSYSFGSVAVGKSTTHAFTLRYSGTGSSGSITVALTPDSGPFAISSNGCDGKSLTGQTTCNVTVRYTPQTAGGTDSATLTATAGLLSSNQVALTGTGTPPPRLTFTPASWDFGPVAVGARAFHTFTLRYFGGGQSGQVSVTLTPRSGPFTISSNNCGGDNLDAQNSCSVTVRYAPPAVGAVEATLTATAGKLTSNSVSLSGRTPSATPMVADPSALHFGEVPIGDFKELSLTFTNTSSTTQSIAWTAVGQGFSSEPDPAKDCFGVLEPGAQCVITVTFVPYSIQTYSDTFYTNWTDGTGKVTKVETPLDGTGIAAKVSVDLSSLSFGNVEVNTTSDAQAITFKNETAATLHVSDVSYLDSQYFSDNASTTCSSLAANDTCTVSVTFKPLAVGEFQAGMILSWAGADNATVTHTATMLTGTGVPLGFGMVEASPPGLGFDWTAVGETSTAQEIIFTNKSVKTLRVLGYESPPATVVSHDCPEAGIGPSQSCTFSVQFKPTEAGWYDGTLKVYWAEPASETAIAENDVPLDGKAYQSGLVSASATELSFGGLLVGGTSAVQTVTFTNESNTPLSMNGLRTPAGFQSTGYSDCNSETGIPHGGTCTISVTFTPTEATAYDDYLVGEWSAPRSEETLTVTKTHLTGTGLAPLSAEPAELAFGELALDQVFPPHTKTITITNNTQSTVWMLNATPPTGFVVFGSSFMGCNFPGLGPGGHCTGLVQFSPTNAQTYSGWFTTSWVTGTQSDPVPVGTTSTSVTGTGVAPTLTTLSINSPAYVHSNNQPNLTFTVTLDHVAATGVSFNWAANDWPDTKAAAVWGTTCDGSADYTSAATTGTRTIAAGDTSTTITFGTCNNGPANVSPITTPTFFTVTISNPSGATITTDTGTGEIRIS